MLYELEIKDLTLCYTNLKVIWTNKLLFLSGEVFVVLFMHIKVVQWIWAI